ncbi:MAG: DNA methyltransferase [Bacillota bacterium]
MIKDIIEANKSLDPINDKIKQLKEIFPGAFQGQMIDLEYIKNQLKETRVTKEGYELNFLGKSYAKLLAALETETVIEPNQTHNNLIENSNSQNVFISADNLDALKHLLNSYWRTIKAIYIDPPYNTGSDGFVYNDSFSFSKEMLIEKLGISDEEAERVVELTNSGSSSHSAWLTFMYPRLYLARQLLRDDGIIFISIDDHEQANLRILCDDIFGDTNFLANITRATGTPTGGGFEAFVNEVDYCLVYAKDINQIRISGLAMSDEDAKIYNQQDEKGRYLTRTLRRTGGEDRREDRPTMYYAIKSPEGTDIYPIGPSGYESRWICGSDKYNELLEDGLIEWKKVDDQWSVYQKFYLEGRQKQPGNLWTDIEGNKKATRQIRTLFDSMKVFETAKPLEFITKIIELSCQDGDYILDFFAGSATTAHAVMKTNSEKNWNLKYILVQLDETVRQGSDAERAGYSTIDQIGFDRIIKSSKLVSQENLLSVADYGFKHFKVKNVTSNQLSKLDSFVPIDLFDERGVLGEFGLDTVLTTWVNLDGYGLSKTWTKIDLSSYEAYQMENTIYLLNSNLTNKAVKTLLEKFEDENFTCNKIILFGYSFGMSEIQSVKDNLKQVEGIKHITLDIIVRY